MISLDEPQLILLRRVKWLHVFLWITNNSIKPLSVVYTQLNYQTFIFKTNHFHISHLFAHSLNVEQFYFTHR